MTCFESIRDRRVVAMDLQELDASKYAKRRPHRRLRPKNYDKGKRDIAPVEDGSNLRNSVILNHDQGTRDWYGFAKPEDKHEHDNETHKTRLAKQRKRWNNYLVLHAQLARSADLKALVRHGIPPELRGRVWQIISGSKQKKLRSRPHDYYHRLLDRARAIERERGRGSNVNPSTFTEIDKDVSRTFPDNALFESKEGLATLRRLLLAYSLHNPKVGYCQSMNFVGAVLLLFMEEDDAFWLLCTVVEQITCLSRPTRGGSHKGADPRRMFYYQMDLAGAHVDQAVMKDLVAEKLPRLHAHLERMEFALEPITINWFLCLLVNAVPLETTLHLWDCMMYEGIKVVFRAALVLLKCNEKSILKATEFDQLLQAITTPPATDSWGFVKMCYDVTIIGQLSLEKIRHLRRVHRARIERDIRNSQELRLSRLQQQQQQQQCQGGYCCWLATPLVRDRPPPPGFLRPAVAAQHVRG